MRAAAAILMVLLAMPAPAGEVAFTAKPTAARDGDKVKIAFAVSQNTDVAVFVENAKGEVVRHLVAGVLGKNPPPPLKPDSLSQTVEWDGKADYGKPAEGGPFKVRVALGLGAKYDRVMSSNRQDFVNINALGTGPDGTLYVLAMSNGAVWSGPQIVALNRDGSYQRMVMPYPTSLKKDQVKGITSFEIDGRPAPLMQSARMGLYAAFYPVPSTNIAVSPDGSKLVILCAYHWENARPSVCLFGADGGTPAEPLCKAVGIPGDRTTLAGFSCVAVSSDGTAAFFGGVQPEPYKRDVTEPALYRVKLPERTGAEPFFCDPAKPGKDDSHLGSAPHGLAVDGKGNLFIADHANDRVVIVSEKDGKFVGEFPATKPDYLVVSVKTGAVYVSNRKGGRQVEVVKYQPEAGFKGAKEVCRIAVDLSRNDTHSVAVDCSAEPAVGWVCDRFGNLIRFEDRGAKFGDAVKISKGLDDYGSLPESYMGVVVDRQRKEIYTRNSTGGGLYYRFSEETGKRDEIRVPGDAFGGGKGFQIAPGADGNLYGLRWPYCMYKWDRSGKPLKWAKPIRPGEDETKFNKEPQQKSIDLGPEVSFVPVSMTELPHTLGVRWSDGHLFAFTFKVRGRVPKCLHEYLTTGEQVTKQPIIWMTSDAIVGPKFDAAGNIYVAEVVKPKGWQPPELAEHFAKTGVKGLAGPAYVAANMYGSIVKFGPKGGTFDLGDARMIDYFGTKGANPFDGDLKLPEGLKTTEAEFLMGDRMRPAKVVGAEWMHPGIGHIGMYACNCENVTFDVDEFGRVFFPDPELFRVRVIDTGGNAITRIGSYGNAESMGPDSPVIDPTTKKLRARKADDPKDLKSPFAEPDIAFAWIVGVGVTDKYIYTGDSLNRRLLKLKMTYAAEETCDVK